MEQKVDYKDFKRKLQRSLMWQYLREKSEYGSKMSERGFQQICADNAGMLAYKLGLNDALAESLAICKGSYFPVYGKAGKNAVHEYLESKNANKTDNELGYNFVKYDMRESCILCPKEFDDYLKELFSDNAKNSSVLEVRIATICYELMELIKPAMSISHSKFLEVEKATFKELEKQCLEKGDVVQIKEFPEIENIVVPINLKLSESDKEIVFKELDYLTSKNDFNKAVLEFIETGYLPTQEKEL